MLEVICDVLNKMEDDNKFINKKKDEIKLVLYNNKMIQLMGLI